MNFSCVFRHRFISLPALPLTASLIAFEESVLWLSYEIMEMGCACVSSSMIPYRCRRDGLRLPSSRAVGENKEERQREQARAGSTRNELDL